MDTLQVLELLLGEKRFYDGAWHVFDAQGQELTAASGVLFRGVPGALLWQRFADEEQDFKGTTYSPAGRGKRRQKKVARHDAFPFAPRVQSVDSGLALSSRDFWLQTFGAEHSQPTVAKVAPKDVAPEQTGITSDLTPAQTEQPTAEIDGNTFAQARDAIERIRAQSAQALPQPVAVVQTDAAGDYADEDEDEEAILALLACCME